MGFEMERAEIYIDGNAACALLGQNLAEGESEWMTIDNDFRAKHPGLSQRELEWRAGREAFEKLKARLGRPLSFVWRKPAERWSS